MTMSRGVRGDRRTLTEGGGGGGRGGGCGGIGGLAGVAHGAGGPVIIALHKEKNWCINGNTFRLSKNGEKLRVQILKQEENRRKNRIKAGTKRDILGTFLRYSQQNL